MIIEHVHPIDVTCQLYRTETMEMTTHLQAFFRHGCFRCASAPCIKYQDLYLITVSAAAIIIAKLSDSKMSQAAKFLVLFLLLYFYLLMCSYVVRQIF